MRIIDLSLPLGEHFRWRRGALVRVQSRDRGDVFVTSRVELSCHSHTHTDAPVHYVEGGRTIDEMPLESWTGEAAIVDLADVPDEHGIEAADLDERGEHVRSGDIVILKTRWDERADVGTPDYWQRAPYVTDGACTWLRERGARCVGFDFPADRCLRDEMNGRVAARHEHTVHAAFLDHDIPIIEYLANLGAVERDRVFLVVAPLKLVGGDASPARAFVIEFDDS